MLFCIFCDTDLKSEMEILFFLLHHFYITHFQITILKRYKLELTKYKTLFNIKPTVLPLCFLDKRAVFSKGSDTKLWLKNKKQKL